jgi:hypothetical protein
LPPKARFAELQASSHKPAAVDHQN